MTDNNNNNRNFTEEDERIMQERMLERRQQRAEQKKQQELKKQKNKQTMQKLVLAAKIFLAVVVVLSLLFVAARSLGNVTFSKAADYISQSISNLKPGDGYPIEVGSGKVKDMQSMGDCVAVLRDDNVMMLNSTAKKLADYTHSYSKPVMSVCSGRMLLTDRTTGRYFIADSSDILHDDELNTEIYCAVMGKKGNYAFACGAEDASSVVKVYGSDYNQKFTFKCVAEYIIDVSLSSDGKQLACIGLGAEKAALYSKIYIIDINEQKVVNEFRLDGKNLSNVFFSSKNTVIAVGETSYFVIEDGKDKREISFGSNTIASFTPFENGNFSIVLTKYGSIGSGVVALFDSKGEEKFTVELGSDVECISYDGKTVCLVDSDNVLYSYNSSGKLVGETQLEMSAQRIAVSGKYCYTLCYGDLLRCDVKTRLEQKGE